MNAVMKEGCLGYPDNYVIREDPDKQIDVWAKLLPELDARKIIGMLPYSISCGAEDCFVIRNGNHFLHPLLKHPSSCLAAWASKQEMYPLVSWSKPNGRKACSLISVSSKKGISG